VKPTVEELRGLKTANKVRDSEQYHYLFDEILEKKLMELDPEWMTEMNKIYDDSKMSKWYA